uniref:Uncharacterized protein n=1 Tax=Rhizophagus irregularis (strain DAOM 181602 / DAOM 197198 / MUCL 43194) TaxID=747089 RepID=U9TZX9_RHIID
MQDISNTSILASFSHFVGGLPGVEFFKKPITPRHVTRDQDLFSNLGKGIWNEFINKK